jgi:hypothetical protein
MYKLVSYNDTLDNITVSSGATASINKWSHLSLGPASVQFEFTDAGQYIEYDFAEPVKLTADEGGLYTVFRLILAAQGVIPPKQYVRGSDFEVSISLHYANEKLIEWYIPIQTQRVSEFDFDLIPLHGIEALEFSKLRINCLRKTTARFFLCGSYLMDTDTEHSLKVAVTGLLNNKLSIPLGVTIGPQDAGSNTLKVSPEAVVRQQMHLVIGNEKHAVNTVSKTPEYSLIELDPIVGGPVLKQSYPPGTPVNVFVSASYFDVASNEGIFPVFYIQGSEFPKRDLLGSSNSLHFGKCSYVRKSDGDYVGIHKPDKAYKYPLQIETYASTFDTLKAMGTFLRQIFDEDSFVDVAGEKFFYEFEGIDPIAEWDSIASLPQTNCRLTFSLTENIAVINYRKFPLLKKVDLLIQPFMLLASGD